MSANSFKSGKVVGCPFCKNELLLNIKQTNHSSSLFITVTVYVCKDQIQLPRTKKAEVVLNSISAWKANRFFGFFCFFTWHLLFYTIATCGFSWWHFIFSVSLFIVFHCKTCLWRSFVHNDVVIKVFYFPFFFFLLCGMCISCEVRPSARERNIFFLFSIQAAVCPQSL